MTAHSGRWMLMNLHGPGHHLIRVGRVRDIFARWGFVPEQSGVAETTLRSPRAPEAHSPPLSCQISKCCTSEPPMAATIRMTSELLALGMERVVKGSSRPARWSRKWKPAVLPISWMSSPPSARSLFGIAGTLTRFHDLRQTCRQNPDCPRCDIECTSSYRRSDSSGWSSAWPFYWNRFAWLLGRVREMIQVDLGTAFRGEIGVEECGMA